MQVGWPIIGPVSGCIGLPLIPSTTAMIVAAGIGLGPLQWLPPYLTAQAVTAWAGVGGKFAGADGRGNALSYIFRSPILGAHKSLLLRAIK